MVVDLFAINDLHGKFCDSSTQAGVDELTTYLKNAYESEDHVLLLSSGDMWQGSSESNLTRGNIITEWMNDDGVNVHLTIDNPQEGWDGHVGFVPAYVKELGFDTNRTAILCGPPIMIKFTLAGLIDMGFSKEQVYTTLEMRMKCGIGKCGRCNVGNFYICKDGPVFRFDQLDELPEEY